MTKAEAKEAMRLHHKQGMSLKAAWAKVRGGQASRSGGHKTIRRSTSGGSKTTSGKSPRMGVAFLGAKLTAQVAAPFIDLATHAQGRAASDLGADLRDHVVSKEYGLGLVSAAAQTWADKKIGQAAALSRGSITAIVSEALPVLGTYNDTGFRDPRATFSVWNARTNGYKPDSQTFQWDTLKEYVVPKYGLGVARKIATRFRIFDPVKRTLGQAGLAL